MDSPRRKKIIRFDEYVFLVCKPFETDAGLTLFISVCAYMLIVAFLCTYYAFKSRGIPDNFNETRYIGFSMYILLLSSLAYYPVAFAFESWYVTIVSCTTTDVSNFVWFVGMHVRTQNLHSLFPIPAKHHRKHQVAGYGFLL